MATYNLYEQDEPDVDEGADDCAAHTRCANCHVEFRIKDDQYICPQCGLIEKYQGCDDPSSVVVSTYVKHDGKTGRACISVGANDLRFQNLRAELEKDNADSKTIKLDSEIISAVVRKYMEMQAIKLPNSKHKSIIKRKDTKAQILAAFICQECDARHLAYQKDDIASFVKLPNASFSTGTRFVMSLSAFDPSFKPVEKTDSVENYANKYLTNLGIATPNNVRAVVEIVKMTEDQRIGCDSRISSKIAGVIWYIISKTSCITITSSAFERKVDNIKKNTYERFLRYVYSQPEQFDDILRQCSVIA